MKKTKSISIEVQGTPVSILSGKAVGSVLNPNFNYGEFVIIKGL